MAKNNGTVDEIQEFKFQRVGFFSLTFTFLYLLVTLYFLWRIWQVIDGQLPLWVAFVAMGGLIYVWYLRLWPVKAITIGRDGRVTFVRGWGRRAVQMFEITAVTPWLHLSRKDFVLRHAHGREFLFEDPEQTAAFINELWSRGVPLAADWLVEGGVG